MRSKIGTVVLALIALVVAAGLVMVLFVVALATPQHNAMAPAVLRGDGLIAWRLDEPKPGDVVVVKRPDDDERRVVSRVVVVGPAELVFGEGGELATVDGEKVSHGEPDPYGWDEVRPEGKLERIRDAVNENLPGGARYRILRASKKDVVPKVGPKPLIIPKGAVGILNDNRGAPESDSRTFGGVPLENVEGVVRWYTGAGDTTTTASRDTIGFLSEVP